MKNIAFILIAIATLSCNSNPKRKEIKVAENFDKPKEEIVIPKLDSSLYEIVKTDHAPTVLNYYVLIKFKDFNQDTIQNFVDKFKAEFCQSMQCNVMVFDNKVAIELDKKNPLEGTEYIQCADHFVAMGSFEMSKILWYPYQDFQYKKFGGNNWKKEPIK